jgi:hypothetical protein
MWASNSEEFPLELAEAVMSNEDDAESLPLWAALDAMVGELPLDARVRAEVRSKLRRYLSRGQAASRPARRIAESIAHRLDQQEA